MWNHFYITYQNPVTSLFLFPFFSLSPGTERVNTYQLPETDCRYVNITTWLKYHDAITINHFIEWGLKQISQLCCWYLKNLEFLNSDYLPCHLKSGRIYTTTVDISVALWIDILHGYTFVQIIMTGTVISCPMCEFHINSRSRILLIQPK